MLVVDTQADAQHYMLQRLIARAGLHPDNFHIEILGPRLFARIQEVGVRVVMPLGEAPIRELLGDSEVLRWFGRLIWKDLEFGRIAVMPNFAPAALLPHRSDLDAYYEEEDAPRKKKGIRNPHRFQGVAAFALSRAYALAQELAAGGEYPVYTATYLTDPSPSQFKAYVDRALTRLGETFGYLSWDIETPYKLKVSDEETYDEGEREKDTTILRISFSIEARTGVSIPWQGPYLEDIGRLLAYTGPHVGWNIVGFDVPLVEANGVEVGGEVLDMMDGWHLLHSDLDKGLEFVSAFYSDLPPWKHLSDSDLKLYSCIDADAALRNAEGITADLKKAALWDRFRKEMELKALLQEAGRRGNIIDIEAQQKLQVELEEKLRQLLLDAQLLVPAESRQAKLYRRKGKGKGHWIEVEQMAPVRQCSRCGRLNINVRHACKDGPGFEIQKIDVPTTMYVEAAPSRDCTLEELKVWLKANGFNPNSTQQLMAYMRANKHPVGYNHKTDQDSADALHLRKLVAHYGKKHPIYAQTLEIHKVQKALSTYVIGLKPDASGRVHTEYVNATSTWRLASRNVNMQNQGKREANPYAKAARKTIIASPGCQFVQADSSAIEAVMVGYFMGDPGFIDLARKSIHAYAACRKLGWEFTPENVQKVKGEQAQLYERMKRTIHLTNYGGTPYMMVQAAPEVFPTRKAAKEMQDFLFDLFPGLRQWHHEVRLFAKKHGYLTSPWGIKHYFYDVFTYEMIDGRVRMRPDGQPCIRLGKDAKRAIAFLPQHSAGMFMRDNLLLLGKTEARLWMPANVSVHDGYCLDVPENKIELATEILVDILTRPIEEMGGLRVGCEVEVGPNWGAMTKTRTVTV